MAKTIDDYILILNQGKCGSSWLAHALTILPFMSFPREFDFIYFLAHPLERQWNEVTAKNPCYLNIRKNKGLSEVKKLRNLYEEEAKKYEHVARIIDKSPSNLYSGYKRFRKLFFKCDTLLLYRDPRDIYISNVFFQHRLANQFPKKDLGVIGDAENKERLEQTFLLTIKLLQLEHTMLDEGFRTFRVRYEDLKNQFEKTIQAILQFLELDLEGDPLVHSHYIHEPIPISKHIREAKDFKPLFRKGVVGDWKNHITEEQTKDWIKENFGSILIQLGYEEDYNW